MSKDTTSFYILYDGHPRYDSYRLIENTVLGKILNKIEMLLFTEKGECIVDYEYGLNIKQYYGLQIYQPMQ